MKRFIAIMMSIFMIMAIIPTTLAVEPTLNEVLNEAGQTREFTADNWAVAESGDYAVSTNHSNSSMGTVSITVTVDAGDVVTYEAMADCEEYFDVFAFLVGEEPIYQYTGEADWQKDGYVFETAGEYELSWIYLKDSSSSAGADCAGLRNIYIGEPKDAVTDIDVIDLFLAEDTEKAIQFTPVPFYGKYETASFKVIEGEDVVTVDEKGVVKALELGTAVIEVALDEVKVEINVTVEKAAEGIAYLAYDMNEELVQGFYKVNMFTNELELLKTYDVIDEENCISAAEYYEGKIYAATTDNRFFVINGETYEIEATYDISDTVLDMAYDYTTHELCGIIENALVIIDMYSGEFLETRELEVEASAFAILDDIYVLLETETGDVYTTKGFDGEFEYMAGTNKEVYFLQTMAFEHETKRLFWLGTNYEEFFTAMISGNGSEGPCAGIIDYTTYEFTGLMFPHADPNPIENVPVTGVTLDKEELIMNYGETQELVATVAPEDATNKRVVWTSNDETVATVDKDGVVTAVGKGIATITVTTRDGNFTDTCTVFVVSEPDEYFVEDFEEEIKLNGWTTVDSDGDGFNWLQSFGDIDAFEGEGSITSVSYDNDSFSALTPDNWLISRPITIKDDSLLSFFVKGQDPKYAAEKYGVYVLPADYTELTQATELMTGVATADWTEQIIDLKDFAGKEVRIAFRHFDVTDMYMLVLDYVSVYASTPFDGEIVRATGVTVAPETATVKWGETLELTTVVEPANATFTKTVWTSSDEKIATVDQNGVVTPVANGTVEITATLKDGGFTAKATITVTGSPRYFIDEDFEDELEGWTLVDADGDKFNWEQTIDEDYGAHEGIGCISSASYDNTTSAPLTPDNWLISPAFTADELTKLSFFVNGQDEGYAAEKYGVYVLPANYTELKEATELMTGIATADWTEQVIDLKDFAGKEIRIAFRHFDITDMFKLNIDDVKAYTTSEAEMFTVTYVDGLTNETIGTEQVASGQDATLPTPPEHEGYNFIGWSHDGKNITEDTTITAQYEVDASLKFGDVNGDGVVNTGDAVTILRYVAEMETLDDIQLRVADVNKDGIVNSGDAVKILRVVAEMETLED